MAVPDSTSLPACSTKSRILSKDTLRRQILKEAGLHREIVWL